VNNCEFDVISGKEFFRDGEIFFPPGPNKVDLSYVTHFGPAASHNGVRYANTDNNFRLAMRRLLGKRLPLVPGEHERLLSNQEEFIKTHPAFRDLLRESYSSHFQEYSGRENEALLHHADPHDKKVARIQAWNEMKEEGITSDPFHLWVDMVQWKLKTSEWNKPGVTADSWKKPRSICDLGVSASLSGFRITEMLKRAQSEEPFHINGGTMVFCKSPDPILLKKHFDELINPSGRFYFLYFSDDSCLAIRNPSTGRVDRYNLDIASCDASHGPKLFDLLRDIMPNHETRVDMDILIRQCTLPLKVSSRSSSARCVLKPKRPFLFTGSTITTAINNLANLLIGLAISEIDYTGHLVDGVCVELANAAASAGYLVTGCDPLSEVEDIQFLKHSPVLDDTGEWRPLLNFGVLVRASGTCNGDLPGRGDLGERARAFQRGLLQGAYPRSHCVALDTMRVACGTGPVTLSKTFEWKVVDNPDALPFRCDETSFARRYRLTALDYQELVEVFANCGYGQVFAGPSLDKILMKDYGLKTIQTEIGEYVHVQIDPNGFSV